VAGQGTAYCRGAQMFLTLLNRVGQSFSVYIDTSYSLQLLRPNGCTCPNPVLGADVASLFYTKEQKMFLLVGYTICNG
jgi:hypothetical protein